MATSNGTSPSIRLLCDRVHHLKIQENPPLDVEALRRVAGVDEVAPDLVRVCPGILHVTLLLLSITIVLDIIPCRNARRCRTRTTWGPGQRSVHFNDGTLPGEVVHDGQDLILCQFAEQVPMDGLKQGANVVSIKRDVG